MKLCEIIEHWLKTDKKVSNNADCIIGHRCENGAPACVISFSYHNRMPNLLIVGILAFIVHNEVYLWNEYNNKFIKYDSADPSFTNDIILQSIRSITSHLKKSNKHHASFYELPF